MVKRVLAGIDFSESSRRALKQAAEWAERLSVPLVAMHVVEHPAHPLFRLYAPMGDPAWFHEFEPKARELMDQWLAPYPRATSLIRNGNAAKTLMEEAGRDALLVVGHVGHGMVDALFGSTAEKISRHAACDVLVVRSDTKY